MIAYKVVEKCSRRGTNWACDGRTLKQLKEQLSAEQYQCLKPYLLTYRQGATVQSAPGKNGMFCFDTYAHAEWYLKHTDKCYRPRFKIIAVELLGEIKKTNIQIITHARNLHKLCTTITLMSILDEDSYPGTLTCTKIKVLE